MSLHPAGCFSHYRNWSWCWAGSGIPPTSLSPVLPGNASVGGWDMAIKDLERRGWVVESPRVGVLGWAGGIVVCHSRGLSLCWGCHTVLGPLCPGLWHCAVVGCAMAGVSHHARECCGCHTVWGVTMHGTCSVMCATCAGPCCMCCAGEGCATVSQPWQGSVCQCRAHCAYWNVQVRCIGAGLYRVGCTGGLICGGWAAYKRWYRGGAVCRGMI